MPCVMFRLHPQDDVKIRCDKILFFRHKRGKYHELAKDENLAQSMAKIGVSEKCPFYAKDMHYLHQR